MNLKQLLTDLILKSIAAIGEQATLNAIYAECGKQTGDAILQFVGVNLSAIVPPVVPDVPPVVPVPPGPVPPPPGKADLSLPLRGLTIADGAWETLSDAFLGQLRASRVTILIVELWSYIITGDFRTVAQQQVSKAAKLKLRCDAAGLNFGVSVNSNNAVIGTTADEIWQLDLIHTMISGIALVNPWSEDKGRSGVDGAALINHALNLFGGAHCSIGVEAGNLGATARWHETHHTANAGNFYVNDNDMVMNCSATTFKGLAPSAESRSYYCDGTHMATALQIYGGAVPVPVPVPSNGKDDVDAAVVGAKGTITASMTLLRFGGGSFTFQSDAAGMVFDNSHGPVKTVNMKVCILDASGVETPKGHGSWDGMPAGDFNHQQDARYDDLENKWLDPDGITPGDKAAVWLEDNAGHRSNVAVYVIQ